MHRNLFRTALLLIAIGIAACNPRVDTPQLGMYRAVLRLPGGDTPFGLEVAQEQQQYVLYLINGAERTRVSNVNVANGELTAAFPGYENSLRATMHRKGLEGSVTLIKAGGKEQVIPFTAKLGETLSLLRGTGHGQCRRRRNLGRDVHERRKARRRKRSCCSNNSTIA